MKSILEFTLLAMVLAAPAEAVCKDIELLDQSGAPDLQETPFEIVATDRDTVSFALKQMFVEDAVSLYIEFHDAPMEETCKRVDNLEVGGLSQVFEAKCLTKVPISIVTVWVAHDSISNSITEEFHRPPCCYDPATAPSPIKVQYTFEIPCQPECLEDDTEPPLTDPPTPPEPPTTDPPTVFSGTKPLLEAMSGGWGVGWRIDGGDANERNNRDQGGGYEFPASASRICQQLTEGFDNPPSYIIINLSAGADGSQYTSPHSVLTSKVPGSTPWDTSPDYDHFKNIAEGVREECGLKVIAYFASEGPAKFKHYTKKCKAGTWCNGAVAQWKDWVANEWTENPNPGSDDDATIFATLKLAYAEVVVREYAEKFKGIIDGYWFDHCNPKHCDMNAIYSVINEVDPSAALSFNADSRKSPLVVQSPGFEDFTSGHPNPITCGTCKPAYDCGNAPMVESIEQSDGGYILDPWSSEKSLGHMFMATGGNGWNNFYYPTAWVEGVLVRGSNLYTIPLQWNDAINDAVPPPGIAGTQEWMKRALDAGGAWSWNSPSWSRGNAADPQTWVLVDPTHVEFMKEVSNGLDAAATSPQRCAPTTGRRDRYLR